MPNRVPSETILARWTIDRATWDRYLTDAHQRKQPNAGRARNAMNLAKIPFEDGMEAIVREGRVSLGKHSVYTGPFPVVRIDHDCLEFGDEDFYCVWAFPISPGGRSEAERIHAAFNRRLEEIRKSSQAQQALQSAPTRSNRLRWWVERRFILVLLAFFFVVLPLCAWFATLFLGDR